LQDNAGSPNNVALSVGNNNVSSTYSGVLSGGGSLTKIGTGRWILSGTNTYTGGTVVSNGNLWINGGIVSSTTVKTNTTLGGNGSIGGAVTIEAGGTLYPGYFGAGLLTLSNNLTLNAASTNSFVVATNGVVTNYVVVAGLLTPNGSIIKVASGTPLAPGTYSNLFTYGSINGSFNPTPIFDVAPAGTPSLVNDGAGHINLVVASSVSLTPPVMTNSVSGNTLTLSWSADHLGYRLLVQTNNLDKGVSGNTNDWATVSGSTLVTTTNIITATTNLNEYYRLVYP